MIRAVTLGLCGLVLSVPALDAQKVRIKAFAVGLTYQETQEGLEEEIAGGGGGAVVVRLGRWRFEGSAFGVRVMPDSTGEDFTLSQVDGRIAYFFAPVLAFEAGIGRRYIEPDFAAQEVGLVRLGLYSETPLARIADIWGRGAYLVGSEFDGGGSAEVAFELGFGVGIGTANGRFRFEVEFEFQRLDRTAGGVDVPIQSSLSRVGLALGF